MIVIGIILILISYASIYFYGLALSSFGYSLLLRVLFDEASVLFFLVGVYLYGMSSSKRINLYVSTMLYMPILIWSSWNEESAKSPDLYLSALHITAFVICMTVLHKHRKAKS